MATTTLLQILVVMGGIVFLLITSMQYAKKRMTEEIGMLWSLFSVLMIVIGLIPDSLAWVGQIRTSVAVVLFGFAFFCLLLLLYLSIVISQLLRKNEELTIQVSLLNQENEQILTKLGMIPEK